MLVNVYGEELPISDTASMIQDLLKRHTSLSDFSMEVITVG